MVSRMHRRRVLRDHGYSYLFVALPIVYFVVFLIGPLIASLVLSFARYDFLSTPEWVGLGNYVELVHDELFWTALGNTVFLMMGLPIGIALSLLLAVAIDNTDRFKQFFKAVYFLPGVCSAVAMSVMWTWLLSPQEYGLLNYLLHFARLGPYNWIGDPRLVKPSLMTMGIWGGLGWNMILFLAGLQAIPSDLYEAAELDGASASQRFFGITLPLLTPTLLFVVVTSVIGAFQTFESAYIFSGSNALGGVLHSALTVVMYVYYQGINQFNMGYACAIAWILFLIIMVMTVINLKILKPHDIY
ncbi:MAG: sugar ABC transporter permease [Clostridia bacterium]|nr:sugar ABC transporter permease [Clostridia bacterium]